MLIVVVEVGLVHPVVSPLRRDADAAPGRPRPQRGRLALLPAVHSRWWLAPSLVLLTVGEGLITTTLASTVAGQVDRGRRGEVLGVQQSAGGLARVIGPALGGVLLRSSGPRDCPTWSGPSLVRGRRRLALAAARPHVAAPPQPERAVGASLSRPRPAAMLLWSN